MLLTLLAVPAFAADLVSVSAHVTNPVANANGTNSGDVLINNIHTADVRVSLSVRVVYANGAVQTLSGITDPGTLPPGGGAAVFIHFVIPPDAPTGLATFIADVTATSGGLQEQESSSASFVVIP
ncbi:MAG TPA: hypothetical protein VF266_09565 [Thermoanaerobaculia bacterium]